MTGLTPKPDKMPQTPEEFQYMGDLYEKGMMEQKAENSQLRIKVNRLEQKIRVLELYIESNRFSNRL